MKNTPSEGSFDCLRLLAAAAVLFSHCYPLLGRDSEEPLMRLTGLTIGTVAVYAFFAISGYLVTQSWLRDPALLRFMLRRSLRIFPALVFVIVASFAILGPLVTDLSPADYFARHDTWSYLSKILIYPAQYGLPGVFRDNPMPDVVNGSLWTLRLEFGLYIVVAALGIAGMLKFKKIGIVLALGCCAAVVTLPHIPWLRNFSAYRQIMDFFANAAPFFAGMVLAQNGINEVKIFFITAMLAAATVLSLGMFLFHALLLLSLPCAVLVAARRLQCHLSRFGDYSYGLYLWGFPVAQTFVHFEPGLDVPQLLWRTGIVAGLLAVISWHLIEKQALRFKPRR